MRSVKQIKDIGEILDKNLANIQYTFIEYDNAYYFFIEKDYKKFVMEKFSGFDLLISIYILRNRNKDIIGYKITSPKNITLRYKNFLFIGDILNQKDYVPYIGLPGIQIYTDKSNVMIISTKITDFFKKIESTI